MAAPIVVPRPTGLEVDDAVGHFLSLSETSKPRRTYHRSFSDCYESRKKEHASTIAAPFSHTFRYSGQGPARSMYNRMLYNKVVIAADVKEILPDAFTNWRNLEQVTFEYPSQCQKIGASAFYGCQKLRQLDGDTLPESLHSIGANAFACSGLERITLPESMVTIRQHAFRGCTSLTRIVVPGNVKTINNGAFQDCSSLQTVMLPRNLKRLEANLFSNCHSLRTLDVHPSRSKKLDTIHDHATPPFMQLPPKLLSVGDECFLHCHQLGPFVHFPSTVTFLGNHVLEGCTNVNEVVMPAKVVGDGCFRNCCRLKRLWLALDVAFGVGVFENCHELQELVDIDTNDIICI